MVNKNNLVGHAGPTIIASSISAWVLGTNPVQRGQSFQKVHTTMQI